MSRCIVILLLLLEVALITLHDLANILVWQIALATLIRIREVVVLAKAKGRLIFLVNENKILIIRNSKAF